MSSSKRILVAPVDWGLGHASRCIPIIHYLLKNKVLPIIATNGRPLQLLQKEFPQLPSISLPAYKIQYPSQNMLWNIGVQLPKIYLSIQKEHQQIKKLVRNKEIDGIISDCRFGCYHKAVKSILITHQVNIKIPFPPFEKIVNWKNHQIIKQFDRCWIPDWQKERLAGDLSAPPANHNYRYLGPVSRMTEMKLPKQYDLIAVLSGPEPQRSYLEKKIIDQSKLLKKKILIVQGRTEVEQHFTIGDQVEVVSFLTSKALNKVICKSDIILARSGYSTIMDLAALKKKAILVPTPGQTEQEYLAQQFHQKKIFYTQSQQDFDLLLALKQVDNYTGLITVKPSSIKMEKIIQEFLVDLG